MKKIFLLLCGIATLLATHSAAQTTPTPESFRAEALKQWFNGIMLVPAGEVWTVYKEAEDVPDGFPPVFRMRINDLTGAAEFIDESTAATTPFLSVGATPDFDPYFVAKVRGASLHGDDKDDVWFPSRREYVYYLPAFSASNPRHGQQQAVREQPIEKSGAPAKPYMAFTGINVLPGAVELDVAWSPGFAIPWNALDLYAKTNLLEPAWHPVSRFIATQSWQNVSFTLDETTVFPGQLALFSNMMFRAPPVLLSVNTHTSPQIPSDPVLASFLRPGYVPDTVVTRNVYAPQHDAGFFKLGTLHDSDFDGVPDAYETLVLGTDPYNPDSDNDGILDEYDPNPLVWDNSMAINDNDGYTLIFKLVNDIPLGVKSDIDSDGDGLMDWEEIIAGTNPFNPNDNPARVDGSRRVFDATFGLHHPLTANVVVEVGDRRILFTPDMWGASSSMSPPGGGGPKMAPPTRSGLAPAHSEYTLVLEEGVAHKIYATALENTVFGGGPTPYDAHAGYQPPNFTFGYNWKLPLTAGARHYMGIIAQPIPTITPGYVCFHDKNDITVRLDVAPKELGFLSRWVPSNAPDVYVDLECLLHYDDKNQYVIGAAYPICYMIGNSANILRSPRYLTRWITYCKLIDYEPEEPGEPDDPVHEHDCHCGRHKGEPDLPKTAPDSQDEDNYYFRDHILVAVNNDDDNGDLILDVNNPFVQYPDNDLAKFYPCPLGPLGECCPCPEHKKYQILSAELKSIAGNIRLYKDQQKYTELLAGQTILAGTAVYCEGTAKSSAVRDAYAVWERTYEDGKKDIATNFFTVASLRIFCDANRDGQFTMEDVYLTSSDIFMSAVHGWMIPVDDATYYPVQLITDTGIPGIRTLTFDGQPGAFEIYQSANMPIPVNIFLLESGQSITNGVDGKFFGLSPEETLYLRAVSNGVATLRYQFHGTGPAEGINITTSLKITAVDVKLNLAWETKNKANQIYNATPKDDPPAIPLNKLYVVDSPQSQDLYSIMLDVDVQPANLRNCMKYVVYNMYGVPLQTWMYGSPASGPVEVRFNHPYTVEDIADFKIMAWIDINGHGYMGWNDLEMPIHVRKPDGNSAGHLTVRGTNRTAYEEAVNFLNTFFDDLQAVTGRVLPQAKSLLCLFMDGHAGNMVSGYRYTSWNYVDFNAFSSEFMQNKTAPNYLSEWLTHNAGANFNDVGAAKIWEWVWNDQTPFAKMIAGSAQIEYPITPYYNEKLKSNVEAYFAANPTVTVVYFPEDESEDYNVPHESESPNEVHGCTKTFGKTWLPGILSTFDDLNGSIGRGRILEHKVRFRVEKKSSIWGGTYLDVTEVKSWGEVVDLYDFNHEDRSYLDAAHKAAILQLVYGNGQGNFPHRPNSGIIYKTRVQFEKIYGGLP